MLQLKSPGSVGKEGHLLIPGASSICVSPTDDVHSYADAVSLGGSWRCG